MWEWNPKQQKQNLLCSRVKRICIDDKPMNKLTRISPAVNVAVHFAGDVHLEWSNGSTYKKQVLYNYFSGLSVIRLQIYCFENLQRTLKIQIFE